jgi:hypothetical protein
MLRGVSAVSLFSTSLLRDSQWANSQAFWIDNDTAAGLANRMARIGLLTRSTDPIDGLRVLIVLTRKGKQKSASAAEPNWRELGLAADFHVAFQ